MHPQALSRCQSVIHSSVLKRNSNVSLNSLFHSLVAPQNKIGGCGLRKSIAIKNLSFTQIFFLAVQLLKTQVTVYSDDQK